MKTLQSITIALTIGAAYAQNSEVLSLDFPRYDGVERTETSILTKLAPINAEYVRKNSTLNTLLVDEANTASLTVRGARNNTEYTISHIRTKDSLESTILVEQNQVAVVKIPYGTLEIPKPQTLDEFLAEKNSDAKIVFIHTKEGVYTTQNIKLPADIATALLTTAAGYSVSESDLDPELRRHGSLIHHYGFDRTIEK